VNKSESDNPHRVPCYRVQSQTLESIEHPGTSAVLLRHHAFSEVEAYETPMGFRACDARV